MAESISDRELVDRMIEAGDEDAFRALYHRHTPYLLQFVVRILARSEADAEDIVQETWVRAAKGFAHFRWESTLRTWLGSIALNLTRGALRNGRPGPRGSHQFFRSVPPAPISDRIDLERAIGRLPDGYRLIVVLHDIEGFTHVEIGELLGIAAVTSRSQLHKARKALRAMLTPAAADAPRGHEARVPAREVTE